MKCRMLIITIYKMLNVKLQNLIKFPKVGEVGYIVSNQGYNELIFLGEAK